MREINFIAVHCTATQPTAAVESIQRHWKEQLGWKSPGYHHLIDETGMVHNLLPRDQVSNGVGGWNHQLINISYIGGVDPEGNPKDTRTPAQKKSLLSLVKELKEMFPTAKVQGHRDFPNVKKACPSFDATREYEFV